MVKLRGQEFTADNFSVTVRNDNSIKFRVRKDGQSMEATLHRTWVFYFEEPQAGLYWDVTPADNAAEVLFLALQMGYRLSA